MTQHSQSHRTVNISKQDPEAYQKMLELDASAEKACVDAGLDLLLVELVKLRVSQLNGCAFCLRMHTQDALSKGETTDRLALVAVWWESQYFSEQEQSALGLAEEVTRLSVPQRTDWDNGSLSDAQVSAVTWLAVVMNSWNRIAVRSHYPVAP